MFIEVFEGTHKRTGEMWAENEAVLTESSSMHQKFFEREMFNTFIRALDFQNAKRALLLL
jgi:hypothetical protein